MIAEEIQAVSETMPFLISLAQWSLHRRILGAPRTMLQHMHRKFIAPHTPPPDRFLGDLDPLDFPIVARREFGIGAIELIGYFYEARARSISYLRELKRRCDGEGVRSLVLTCGAYGAIGDPRIKQRHEVIQRHLKWLDMAAYLGCHSVIVRVASSGSSEEQARLVAESLHELGEWSLLHGLNVLVENHNGLSSDTAWLNHTLELADQSNVGVALDWGNFESESGDRPYLSVAEMMPHTHAVTAKCYDFGPDGNETSLDFSRFVRIITDANYRRHIAIEYEGHRMSEGDGVRACKALLERLQRAEPASPHAPESSATRPTLPVHPA